ncbi:MAG: tripartite tricarboxylate transporter permease [Dehalococcoidia bacterium]
MLEAAAEALALVLAPERIGFLLLGVSIGFVVGILPGLGGLVGMSLLLPFIFGMDAFSGVALMIGMVSVIHTSDTFPAVLLGVPGSTGSQATIMDGYPLSRQGQAATALGAAFFSSLVGGVIGGVSLFAIILVARPLVLALNSPALFMLVLLGLSMVGVLSRHSAGLGILAGLFGMLINTIGAAPAAGLYRYSFGSNYLADGIPLPILALGLFAIPELLSLLLSGQSVAGEAKMSGSIARGLRLAMRNKWLLFRSSVLGTAVGIVPGLGGTVVDWIAYGMAKQTVRDNHFGTGDIRGVIAPESANNAKEGGALVPSLLFGIPGSGTTAVLLGGLIMLGIQPGPSMVGDNLDVTLSIIWTLVIGNVFAALICLASAGFIAKLTMVPSRVFAPFLLVLLVLASYQTSRQWGDIIALTVFGGLGWFMFKYNWPRAPMLIGFVLGTSAERYLGRSIGLFGFEWLTQPLVIVIGIVIVVTVIGLGRERSGKSDELSSDAKAKR